MQLATPAGSRYEALMKYLHTMIRVTDLDRSIKFYCDGLGFKLTSKTDYPDGRFTLAFLCSNSDHPDGLQSTPQSTPMLELTYNWDTKEYERGDAYGHVAYAVDSI